MLISDSVGVTALFIFYSLKISWWRVNNWNIDAGVWNLKEALERKAGVPGVTCHSLIFTPFSVSSLSVNCLSDFHCLSKDLLLLRILVSSLFLTVAEWLIWILGISQVSIRILFILKMCCHLSASSSARGSTTLTSSEKGLSFTCCSCV